MSPFTFTPNRVESPKRTIDGLGNLAAQVQKKLRTNSVGFVAEEMDLPRDMVRMLSTYSR